MGETNGLPLIILIVLVTLPADETLEGFSLFDNIRFKTRKIGNLVSIGPSFLKPFQAESL